MAVASGLAGAALLLWSGALHFYLWVDYFHRVRTIGPMFLAQGVLTVLCAGALVLWRRPVVAGAGAVVLAATAGALLVSVWTGLFGYHERMRAPYVGMSLVVESLGTGVLLVAARSGPRTVSVRIR